MMKQLTKKSLLLIPITLCGLVLSGCGQSSNDDIGSVHTSISNTKHHDSAEKNDTKSKHKSHKNDDSDKATDNKKDKEKESDKSKNQSHKHHKTESASSLKDKNKDKDSDNNSNNDVKDETKNQDNKTAANGNNTSNNNKNNDTAGQSNNSNGDNQVYTAEQDNQKFMNTKPDKVLPPVNTSTPQQPTDNSEDSQGKTTYKITGGGQAQQDDRKVNVSGNTASYNGESISANDFNTAKNYFESKKLDEPDYIYFEWAKYAKDHKCSLDDAYKQNINMVN